MQTFLQEHPTGIGTVISGAVVAVASDQGWIHWTDTTAALVVAAIAGLLSMLSPRFRAN